MNPSDANTPESVLHEAVDHVTADQRAFGRVTAGLARRQRRRRLAMGGFGAAGLAVCVVAATLVADDGSPRTTTLAADGTTTAPPLATAPAPWQSAPPPPLSARRGAMVVADADRLVIWGGVDDETGRGASSLAVFQPDSDTWSMLDLTGTAPRVGASGALSAGDLYLVGGSYEEDGPAAPGIVHVDLESGGSEILFGSEDVRPGADPIVTLADGELVVVGGRSPDGAVASTSAEAFDLASGTSTAAAPAPWPVAADSPDDQAQLATGSAGADGTITIAKVDSDGSTTVQLSRRDPQSGGWSDLAPVSLPPNQYAIEHLHTASDPAGVRFAVQAAFTWSTFSPDEPSKVVTFESESCEGSYAFASTSKGVLVVPPCPPAVLVGPDNRVEQMAPPFADGGTHLLRRVGNVIVAVDFGDARGDQNGPARPGATSVLR